MSVLEARLLSQKLPQKLHGRRRGRKLRPGQHRLLTEKLPRLLVTSDVLRQTDASTLFPAPIRQLWLEIGFGAGEHLAWQAAHHKDVGFIGCEVFENGQVSLLHHIEQASLTNIRIASEDARLVLDALPPASLHRVFVLFPDPWPKSRHHKRRLISQATMDLLARVLVDGGELRLATDDPPYLRVMLVEACGHPEFDWMPSRPAECLVRPADWPPTRYEAKALAAGRQPAFLTLSRRPRGAATTGEER